MILDTLADSARKRVLNEKLKIPFEEIKEKALSMPAGTFEFERAVSGDDLDFICEIKKASPSKGVIAKDFPYVRIAKEYEEAGASCVSVLTEPEYFKGDRRYLKEISENVSIPLLRKDFIVDPYMIYDAKVCGASCVLLICSLLSDEELGDDIAICDRLGMSALVEAHDGVEVRRALGAGARMVGVNNRDLKTFTVDLSNSIRLRPLVPESVLFVAESGIETCDDIKKLCDAGVDAVLIGETLMKAEDKKSALNRLRGAD